MDQSVLVSGAHALISALEADGLRPRFAMWVHNSDAGTWKLWIVPSSTAVTKYEFYRRVSRIISKDRSKFGGMDASDIEIVGPNHPAMIGMKSFITAPGLAAIQFSGNRFNGFYLPDGIILTANL